MGRPLRHWQRAAADTMGEVLPSGRMVYPLCVMIVPRRAGKTGLVLPTALQRAMTAPRRRCWYTAQTGGDAATIFREEWVPLIKGSALAPFIRARMSNGSQRLMLPEDTGSYVGLFAPGPKAVHGQDADHVTVDEAWAFTEAAGTELEDALRPAMLLRPQKQLLIVSAGGTDESTWLLRLRALGRRLVEEGRCEEAGMFYLEFYPPGELDAHGEVKPDTVDLEDRAVWAQTHPIVDEMPELLDVLAQDRLTMGAGTFRRSYLNVFARGVGERLISAAHWDPTLDEDATPPATLTLGYDVAHDRSRGSIAVAGRLADGRTYGEITHHESGTEWMPAVLERMGRELGVQPVADGVGPVVTVTKALEDRGVVSTVMSGTDYPAACASLYDEIVPPADDLAWRPRLARRAQPPLDRAVEAVERRDVGDAWVWSRKRSGGDISPLVALTAAASEGRRLPGAAPFIWS